MTKTHKDPLTFLIHVVWNSSEGTHRLQLNKECIKSH